MLGILREWSGKDNCRAVIEFRQGAWDIAMSYAAEGQIPDATLDSARGTGKSFDDAWDNMNPTWA